MLETPSHNMYIYLLPTLSTHSYIAISGKQKRYTDLGQNLATQTLLLQQQQQQPKETPTNNAIFLAHSIFSSF